MKMRRLVSSLLAVLIVMSCLSVGIVVTSAAVADTADTAADISVAAAGSAYSDMQAKATAENKYGLSETVNDGTILQAWNWSYANITANLETVAAQGFTTIQVSPPNEIKQATKGVKFTAGDSNGWWMFYQPVGFQINQSTDNALGTKSEFVTMCSKAHELGLKVIADAVINHVGTKDASDSDTNPMNHVHNKVQTYEPEIYNNKLFHSPWKKMQYIESNASQYDSTYDLTRNCTSGLPDLKTEDSRVQSAIYDYLEELIQAGADGFRFDAAKHIETPDDISGLKSDFWTNTLQKVQKAHSDKEIYAYGEILNTCGVNRSYSMYTKLFDVTDSASYWNIKDAVCGNGGNAIPYYPSTNFTAANTMLWDESHDTYVDGATTSLSAVQRGKIWALVAGRSGISSVYLARPSDSTNIGDLNSITLGEARKTAWSNATTKAINQFHNYFIGQSEYCSSSGGTAWIERGTKGAMIVNLGGTTSKSVNLKANRLSAGDYIDAITGNKFTVSGGYIKGQVGTTGVAAIYENTAEPEPTDPPETYILGDVDLDGAVDVADATLILRHTIDMADFTDKQKLAADVDGDGYITVIDATLIQRYDLGRTVKYDIGKEKTVGPTPTPQPTTPIIDPTTSPDPQPGTFLLTDNFGWGTAYVYAWDDDGNELNGAWPGSAQAQTTTNEYGETQFICSVPEGATGVILSNGNGAQTEDITDFSYDGYWMDGSQNELGHYKVIGWNSDGTGGGGTGGGGGESSGSFLLTDNFGWGSAYVYAWDADGNALNGEWPGASQAQTTTNEYGQTQFVCYIPEGAVGVILSNGNGAQTEDITDFSYDGYWMDGSQNELGHYKVIGWNSDGSGGTGGGGTGGGGGESSGSFLLTDNFGWGTAYVYAWDDDGNELNGAWPGSAQAQTTTNEYGETQFICYVPEGATGVILSNGNGAQTEDITDFSYDGYWMDGSQNELGHYKVTGWNSDGSGGTGGGGTGGGGGESSGSFLLTDNFGWGTAYVYAWDADGNELNGAWPGSAQAQTTTNEYGETQFVCNVPEGAVGVILSNGNGAQTEDITDFSYDGYWMDGSQNELGHYKVTGWNSGGAPDPTPDPTQPDTPIGGDGGTIIFSNNKGFSTVNIYYWADGSEGPVAWPGVPMTSIGTNDYGEERFTFTMPEGMTNYIINDGNQQTVDIPFTGSTGVYMTDQDDEGHYQVEFYAIDGSDPTPDPTQPYNPPTPSGTSFLLTDNFGWGTAYVYAWDDDGNELNGAWPGSAQAQTTTNEYGETQFVCEVPAGATGVILSNGNGAQTEDITDFSYDGYWMDGTQNELGHYKVTGWNSGDTPDPTPDPTQPYNPPTPSGTSFLLTDNFGWGTAYVYAWDDDGNELNGAWPGSAQAQTTTNEYGETQFVCEVPAGATGVILSNGNGAQTEDITDFSYDGFWMDGTQNELGHYKVTGWNSGDTPDPTSDPTPDPTQPDTPIGGDGGTIIFSNNKGFSTVNIYYWADGSEGPVAWPGVPMTSIGTNDYGEERFTFTMPEGMTNYIINDGNQQTVDIPFTGSTGVYMTDKDSEGHYQVEFYEIDGSDPTPDPTQPDDPTPSGTTFLLTDNFGWGKAYVYAWDDDGNELNGAWPGSAQAETITNDYGETQFKCVVPAGATGIILSNGNGAQTEDITDFSYTGYWMDGTQNELGHYKVTGWN